MSGSGPGGAGRDGAGRGAGGRGRAPRRHPAPPVPASPFEPESLAASLPGQEPAGSLLDLVDNLLDQGVVVTGDAVLGLAGVDLVYLRLSLLLAAADRVLPPSPTRRGEEPE